MQKKVKTFYDYYERNNMSIISVMSLSSQIEKLDSHLDTKTNNFDFKKLNARVSKYFQKLNKLNR
jgi:subtilase family serine protease